MTWDELYNILGVRDFIYFISSSQLQDYLFPVKIVFVTFAMFFLAGVIYFMINSSWLQYKFLEDVTEFFSWKSYGLREISKRWSKIKKRVESGAESDIKLALIEADDFLSETLQDAGFGEDSFEESLKASGRMLSDKTGELLSAHEARNSIVYNPDFKISVEQAKKMLDVYEWAVNSVGLG
ncbi:MAG: hypothetical protein A2599_01290 [Candidatus Staskawiczbacteria bacterium RIFOXYD1_FULL_39_28]|uniref:DUF4129 domain-containing protein n=1 Tax=Candidatus Staskawiczbacteria bacterium RIFOXYC1_FULL_38_18 TaxID=1802229 RepID=A0A1G2JEL6_9BACT|nr:MAG: hypothetical protein A2401_02370 [Candidatus Staskawiczbacteria bacterium RIFOXYC1_FULL_38_18]OGZ92501.1 MAG: hypothetical protein A2599_01290 [Candidatus Staskawiczbacteria bacterium RIFOXYD1_FULL_39_28]